MFHDDEDRHHSIVSILHVQLFTISIELIESTAWDQKAATETPLTILPDKHRPQHHHHKADWINNFESTAGDQKEASHPWQLVMEKVSWSPGVIGITISMISNIIIFIGIIFCHQRSQRLNQSKIYNALHLNLFQTCKQLRQHCCLPLWKSDEKNSAAEKLQWITTALHNSCRLWPEVHIRSVFTIYCSPLKPHVTAMHWLQLKISNTVAYFLIWSASQLHYITRGLHHRCITLQRVYITDALHYSGFTLQRVAGVAWLTLTAAADKAEPNLHCNAMHCIIMKCSALHIIWCYN